MSDLGQQIAEIRMLLERAAISRGRQVKLVAVTKTVSAAVIGEAVALGLTSFGENRIQEALPKVAAYPQADWHFIGRLQTNKAKEAVENFGLIHSLDRWKLAVELDKQAAKLERKVQVLVQVNIAGEKQKGGLAPEELKDFLHAAAGLTHLCVEGLMSVPPNVSDPEETRPYFKRMYRIFQDCRVPGIQMRTLSMGMSQDFVVAVEEGSNLVRVGSALFGVRS
jgi:hypothetical protein